MLKIAAEIIKEYYLLVIAFLSIFVFFAMQFLTRGVSYFINELGGVRWRFLFSMCALQFFISCLVTWSVINAFASEFLQEYESIKMTTIIVMGASPFNIAILIWVALKLEFFRIMKNRYKEDFDVDKVFTEMTIKKPKKHKEKSTLDSKPQPQEVTNEPNS